MVGAEAVGQLFALHQLGWSTRRIAQELGISRTTVKAWLRKGPGRVYQGPNRAAVLEPHLEWIRERWRAGVRSGDVFRQELAAKGVNVSLRTVERAICPLRRELLLVGKATLRFETPPGKQMQVDFGEKWLDIGGVPQKRYVFVATLGYSRRTYAQAFGSMRQRDWIAGMEGAFRHFGGVPQEILSDNAKPLVLRQQSGKAVFHPEFAAFCSHWGVLPRACQPYRARTKGKVENGVGYVKRNALGGPGFESDEHLDRHLETWLREVADLRTHGTTHEQPLERFLHAEQAALAPLGNHPSYLRQRHCLRKVAMDGHVEVDTNRYSVPSQFLGETVEVLVEADWLRVLWRDRVVAEHSVARGRFETVQEPRHLKGILEVTQSAGKSLGIQRDLAEYEKVVGGEA